MFGKLFNFQRYSGRLDIQRKLGKKIDIRFNIYLTRRNENREASGALNWILLPPVSQAYDSSGSLVQFPTADNTLWNPLWNIREYNDERNRTTTNYNLVINYKIFSSDKFGSLKYKLNFAYRRTQSFQGEYLTSKHQVGINTNGRATIVNESNNEILVENILTYENKIGKNHEFDVTFVQSINERRYEYTRTRSTGFTNDILGYNGISSATDNLQVVRNATRRFITSFMGRLRYTLKNKYLFSFTARADASSVFAEGNKWGAFPSASLGWKAHKESFLKNAYFINELKLRASYGSTGNQAISPYQTLGTVTEFQYVFNGETATGYLPNATLLNPNLKWEVSTSANLGIDFRFFKIFSGSLDIYNTNTTDLLVNRSVAGATGYTSTTFNAGKIRNRGIEALLSVDVIRNKSGFDWTIGATFSSNQNRIISLYGETDANGKPIDDIDRNLFINHPIDVIYQYEFDGIWQLNDDIAKSHMPNALPGDIRVKDVSGPNGVPDGVITADDLVVFKKDPNWFGSFSSTLSYKGIQLLVDVYIVQGSKKTNDYLANSNLGAGGQGRLNGVKVNYYTPENASNEYPRPNTSVPSYLYALAVSDASFVRLRTVKISYQFPENMISFMRLSQARVYWTGTNLLTFTKYLSYNPEVNPGAYPDGREITFGIQLSF